jgi:hypothetical protein
MSFDSVQQHISDQALATHVKFQEQGCIAWTEAHESKQRYESATLAFVEVNPLPDLATPAGRRRLWNIPAQV